MSKQIDLLGYSPFNLPVLMDILHESEGFNFFRIIKNMQDDALPVIENTCNHYRYELVHASDVNNIGSYPISFGITGAENKIAVLNYFVAEKKIQREQLISIIHSSAYLASSSIIHPACLIEPCAIISSQTTIEYGVSIRRGVQVGHHCTIGAFTDLNPGCVISGNVHIGSGCQIGSGAVIRNNVSIGKNTVIGMGSIVTKDIPDGVIAYGNTCKVVRPNESGIRTTKMIFSGDVCTRPLK